jgi:hypothetical protein
MRSEVKIQHERNEPSTKLCRAFHLFETISYDTPEQEPIICSLLLFGQFENIKNKKQKTKGASAVK